MDPTPTLADLLDAALPQTQCTRCGYADCRGYADALARGDADIDRCPPGGAEGIARLAALTGRPSRPLDPANGREGPRLLAVIDEAACIGCTICLRACPVDCIVGAPKSMHAVIDDLCTGCERCVPVCPVDCIALVPVTGERTGWAAWSAADAARAAARYAVHRSRLGPPPADAVDLDDGAVVGAAAVVGADASVGPDAVVDAAAVRSAAAFDTDRSVAAPPVAVDTTAPATPSIAGVDRALIEAVLARARAARPAR